MSRAPVLAVLALLATIARANAATAAPPTSPFDYTLFGVDGVRLKNQAVVTKGTVGANLGTAILGAQAVIKGDLAAFRVRLGDGAKATRLFCLLLDATTTATCRDVVMPLVSAAALPPVLVAPGQIAVRVGRGKFSTLAPGTYGTLRLGPGSALLLPQGTFAFRSVHLLPRAALVCQDQCAIEVQDRVLLDSRAQIRPSPGPQGVRIDVQGAGKRAFQAAVASVVVGTVYAPAGTLTLGPGGAYKGSFVGRNVIVGSKAQVSPP
jgi:hypothetical protein